MFKTVAILASLVGGKYISIIVDNCLCLYYVVYYVSIHVVEYLCSISYIYRNISISFNTIHILDDLIH